jgi:hypothetical protein
MNMKKTKKKKPKKKTINKLREIHAYIPKTPISYMKTTYLPRREARNLAKQEA